MYQEFFHYLKTAFVPFLDASVYGRSILENSSFIASLAHMDARLHGTGYVSRLTGASAEMLTMWRMMTVGQAPFVLNANGELNMVLDPKLPGWLFTDAEKQAVILKETGEQSFCQPDSTFAFCLLGSIVVIYYNDEHLDTYEEGVQVTKIILCQEWEAKVCLEGSVIPAPYAEKVRMGEYDTIKAVVSRV